MLKQQTNIAAVYCRLSRDDGADRESNSIITQKQMLRRYAKEQGFAVYGEYIDDGISGTTFDRPDFKRMIRDIEDGKIGIVLCKDLSRLGRNNALVVYYTEIFFPDNDVRFIAVSDAIDTFKGENEIMAFKSVVNEYYARDISKKIRSAYRTKALNGEFTGSCAPYGYRKDPENKYSLIPDELAAEVVRRIFQMAADGLSPFKIAGQLSKECILTPRAYISGQCGKYKNCFNAVYPTDWSNSTVAAILQNREYLGHLVCNRKTTKSFKNKKLVPLPKNEWIETLNTHEAIVDQYLFDLAQKVVSVKKRENTAGHINIFAGLLKCSDCGCSLGYVKGKTEGHQGAYNCNQYRQKSSKYCTSHYITYKWLYALVLEDIQRNAAIAGQFEGELSEHLRKIIGRNSGEKYARLWRDSDKFKQRNVELDAIIKKLFEQNALGGISDERFVSMAADYEREQKELSAKIAGIQAKLNNRDQEDANTAKFLKAVRKYGEITELNANILNDLIDTIVIYNAEVKGMKKDRVQKVEINYKFIGLVQLNQEEYPDEEASAQISL